MKKLLSVFLLIMTIFMSNFISAQNKKSKIESVKLTENIYKFVENEIVNVLAFVGPDGVLLVDDGYDKNPARGGFVDSPLAIREELKKIGNDNIKYIINTHTDLDHANGNAELGKNASIIAHRLGRERLSRIAQFSKEGLPNLVFDDSLNLFFNNEEIKIFYLPGHTNHDIIIEFKNAKIVCVGDLIIPDSFGSISATGDVISLIKGIRFLYNKYSDDVRFIAGHDRVMERKDLMIYADMIEKTKEIVVKEIKKGKTIKDMQKDDILKEWKKWTGVLFKELNADMWIGMLYGNIIKKIKPSASEKIGEMIRKTGFEPSKADIHKLLTQKKIYYFMEREFNILGYNLINEGKIKDAIEVFRINVKQYPESWNVYDSLGEAYALAGSKELAIENYEKSMKINPDNKNGADALKKLREIK